MIARASLAILLVPTALAAGGLFRTSAVPRPPLVKSRTMERPHYLNPCGVAVDYEGRLAYVALSGTNELAVVDIKLGEVIHRIPCPDKPTEVALCLETICVKTGSRQVVTINRRTFETEAVAADRLPAEVGTALRLNLDFGPVALPDSQMQAHQGAFVGNEWFGSVPGRLWSRVAAPPEQESQPRQPRIPDDSLLGTGDALRKYSPPPGVGFQGGLGFGGGNTVGRQFQTAQMEWNGRAYAAPSDVVGMYQAGHPCLPMECPSRLAVAAAGSDSILFVDRSKLEKFLKHQPRHVVHTYGYGGIEDAETPVGPPPPATYVTSAVETQANPRRLSLSGDGKTLVVSNYLSDSLTIIDVTGGKTRLVRHVALSGPPPDAARRGEILFHSAKLAASGRFTCATCHPGGGSDGEVWDMPGDDLGARRTRSLLGARDHAPYGWLGDSATLAARVRKTLSTLHGVTPSDRQVEDLAAYLETLRPPTPRPIFDWYETGPVDGYAVFKRGKALFEGKAGCARCHSGEAMQDHSVHDVGTGGVFRTPSLRGFEFTGLFLHDGSKFDFQMIFEKPTDSPRHGHFDKLTQQEKKDLIGFLQFS
jgi:mono/diheme cytochrome c family protein